MKFISAALEYLVIREGFGKLPVNLPQCRPAQPI
jgi:hypothetical protein